MAGRLLARRIKENRARAATMEDYSRARVTLDSVIVESATIKRILATEDVKFISNVGAQDVHWFFLKERRGLAIQWLRTTQRQVAHLMDLHLKLAGYTDEPNPSFEFGLSVRYLCFIVASNLVLALLWLRGPFEAVRIVGYTLRGAEHFCSACSLRLERVDPVRLDSARLSTLE